jgi:hypothetical protein
VSDGADFTVSSNLIMNVPKAPSVDVTSGTLTADYNLFFDPQATNYSDTACPLTTSAGPTASSTPCWPCRRPRFPSISTTSASGGAPRRSGRFSSSIACATRPSPAARSSTRAIRRAGPATTSAPSAPSTPNAADLFGG